MTKIGGLCPAAEAACIRGDTYRITVLTSRLLRLEYDPEGTFEDTATGLVINRTFPHADYCVSENGGRLEVVTEHLRLDYDKQPFSELGLTVTLRNAVSHTSNTWYYGTKIVGLYGTARTLDEADGAIALEPGILSRDGFMVVDDSESMLIDSEGWMHPRRHRYTDIYFFGYSRDYEECLRDFFCLSGMPPLLPRFALGNWWSRYHPYSETSYNALLDEFNEEEIPLSVAVLDMDWHLTGDDVPKEYGSGWTGYTWDRKLIPDPPRFLKDLHKRGLHIALNIHPADGARPHEEAYRDMATSLSTDPDKKTPLPFDASCHDYLDAYFKYLHHPHEEIGVDFWWIDWQQQGGSRKEGYDPLWVLNHSHFHDNARGGKRPIILSRYPGLGGHRYPIGFSGDTCITWESLDFQPYFTSTASNAGFGWWSHDIGGHMHGYSDDELAVRWLQFGVFSPITRIHCSNNPFMDKRPSKHGASGEIMRKFLRLRHKLIPYIYTLNYRCHKYGKMPIEPMYYRHAFESKAYAIPNQYYFGDLIVCPMTMPRSKVTLLSPFEAWLPHGLWWDVMSGRAYGGGRSITLYRPLETLPVFAKAGSIITLDKQAKNGTGIPETLEIMVFAGDSGTFEMYEDDGRAEPVPETTRFELIWGENPELRVSGGRRRNFVVKPVGFSGVDTEIWFYDVNEFALPLPNAIAQNDTQAEVFAVLERAQISYDLKLAVYDMVSHGNSAKKLSGLFSMNLDRDLFGAILEVLTAQ